MEKVTIVKNYDPKTNEYTYTAQYVGGVGTVKIPAGSKLERICKDAFDAIVTEYIQAGHW